MEKKLRLISSLFIVACILASIVQTASAVEWYDSGFLPMGHGWIGIWAGSATSVSQAMGEFVACIFFFPPMNWYAYLEWQWLWHGEWMTIYEQVVTVIWLPAPLMYLGTWYGQAQLFSGTWRCRITWLSEGIWHSCRQDSWSFTIS